MSQYFANTALLNNGWASNVRVTVNAHGIIEKVAADTDKIPDDIHLDDRVLLPAPSNLHSHGFQRALAGLTEFRSGGQNDSFWTWRTLMYEFLEYLTPSHMRAINAFVQMEMLQAGYASLGEFHYVHHQNGGQAYENPAELANCIADAAQLSGIGLTLLPVYYAQGGVDGRALEGGQLRFKNDPDSYDDLWQSANNYASQLAPDYQLGIAPHSLRAVNPDHLKHLTETYANKPIHIHIAEQVAEIDEISAAYGARPVQWLFDHTNVSENWCLVHATHLTPKEVSDLAGSGATAGLCPVTEANLGDGIFDGISYLEQCGAIGIGTDSNISISFAHELRLLEYSQRLQNKGRALLSFNDKSTGRTLFEKTLKGGANAIGRKSGQIEVGYLADMVTLDHKHVDMIGLANDYLLDSWVFASKDDLVCDVISAGRHVIKEGRHIRKTEIDTAFMRTISELRALI